MRRSALDWILLVLLAFMWGVSFAVTKTALESVPPLAIVTARVAIAAVVLSAVAYFMGAPFPRARGAWWYLAAIGLGGNALPFFLISWGQLEIDSGLAGVLLATMPLVTLALAHVFVDGERVTAPSLAGFLLGFAGVVVLVGPEVLGEIRGDSTSLVSLMAVLGGAFCYSVSAVLARKMPSVSSTVAAAAVMAVASGVLVPLCVTSDLSWTSSVSARSVGAVAWLGLVSTAAANVVYFRIVASAGPTFLSLINYMIPIVAVLCGVAALGERPGPSVLAALGLVLSGVAISRLGGGVMDANAS